VSLALWQTALVFAAVVALAELARVVIVGLHALERTVLAADLVLAYRGEKDEKKFRC
jgi:predicted lysophospholipase L1 biosynthesis ABC-type transport system permease subunit